MNAAKREGRISFDFSNMFAAAIGKGGISKDAFAAHAAQTDRVHQSMLDERGSMAWRDLPYTDDALIERIVECAAHINESYDNFVVLGIGGSALGSKAIFNACCHPRYNELSRQQRGGCRFYVEDNVDPDKLSALLDVIDLRRSVFHIITKSGSTVETLSQFMLITHLLQQAVGDDYGKQIIVTTDAKSGLMRRLADEHGWQSFVVPQGVGGRFSVLSPVGLLSAAVLNLDVRALLAGAAAMDKACSNPNLQQNPAYMYACLYTLAMSRGINISVMMPYGEALASLSEWYCQLWAESLGKSTGYVCYGQTPVRAMGTVDQHSQVQLYTQGPADKIVSFVELRNFGRSLAIPQPPFAVAELEYLRGCSFERLMATELQGTRHALVQQGRMNNTVIIEQLDEYTLGELFFFYEMATAAAGAFLQINAFDQPGVEAGKQAAFALLGRPGYEHSMPQHDDRKEKVVLQV